MTAHAGPADSPTGRETQPSPASRKMFWAGWIISILPVLLLLSGGVMKLIKPTFMVEDFARLGYPEHLIVTIGILKIACTVVYLIPRTAVLGAILLTGYLGGATATGVRVGDPFFWPPIVFGVLIWLGIFLRDPRLRALLPWRRSI
ncbi:MAG: DoxX family protein [Phycisphaeraceae bacterium]